VNVEPWGANAFRTFSDARAKWGAACAYEQAWLYLKQALRHGGWSVSATNGWLAVADCYSGSDQRVIVSPLAHNVPAFIQTALKVLRDQGLEVDVAKHLSEEDATELVALGGTWLDTTREVFDELAEISEDAFPQALIGVAPRLWSPAAIDSSLVPTLPNGREAADFRYQVRRFLRRSVRRQDSIVVTNFKNDRGLGSQAAIDNWMASIRARYGTLRPVVRDFAKQFRSPVEAVVAAARGSPENIHGEIIEVGGVPRGLWLGQAISARCLGVYALLGDTRVTNLSDFVLLRALEAGRDLGVEYVNLGGSELASLFHFKIKASRSDGARRLLRKVIDVGVRLVRS